MPASGSGAEAALHQFLSVLSHMGWALAAPSRPGRLQSTRALGSLGGAPWVSLPLPEGQFLVVLSLAEDLPPASESFKRYEDLAILHRRVMRELDTLGIGSRYLVLLGGRGAHLLDRAEEDLLLAAESREECNDRLLPLLDLQAIARGSLTAYPRKPLRQLARELADWTALWSTRIGGKIEASAGSMWRFFDWLHLARVAEVNGVGATGDPGFATYPLAARAPDPKRLIAGRFGPLHEHWCLLQEAALKNVLSIASADEGRELMMECLRSYGLMTHRKFRADVLAEAFADDEWRVRSWRESVTAPALAAAGEVEEPAQWLVRQLPFDLDRQGFAVLLRRTDELIEIVRRVAIDRESAQLRGERVGLQMDLLSAPPPELEPDDAPRHVLGRVLRLSTADPARANLARTILLARGCEWLGRLHRTDRPLPRIDIALHRAAPPPEPPPAPGEPSLN